MEKPLPRKDIVLGQEDIVAQALESGTAIVDDAKATWNKLVDQILAKDGRVIALRGAGSINGSDRTEADHLLETELIPRVKSLIAEGKEVTVLYDGDPDALDRPDIGYFAGRLLDHFGNNQNGVTFIIAQQRSWYYPKHAKGNLSNANGLDFVTYVFEDGAYPGNHNSFTQDLRLVESAGYEQWYIGASGETATAQLLDFNDKVPNRQLRVATLFRVRNNPNLEADIREKLNAAQAEGDETKTAKFQKQLIQRREVYGTHWDNSGNPRVQRDAFPRLQLSFVTAN